MRFHFSQILRRLLALMVFLASAGVALGAASAVENPYPRPIDSYGDTALSVGGQMLSRIQQEPFNVFATLLFFGAILHTFLAPKFMAIAHRYAHAYEEFDGDEDHPELGEAHGRRRDRLRFRGQLFHFLGEIEAVFGIWAIPLGVGLIVAKGWPVMVDYFGRVSYAEPVFVVVVMAIAASRPILRIAEACLAQFAALGGGTVTAWWLSILTVGPLLGSFITEPAAMTICALLLSRRFYELQPSMKLRYATLGLLFVNISVGGTLTHFAAPPVVMVAQKWGWGLTHMLGNFGWKAAIGIVIANALHFIVFRAELARLVAPAASAGKGERPLPAIITVTHLLFIAWTVLAAHYPPLVILGFLFFFAFVEATPRHQSSIQLRSPLLVGFFLAALVIHGGGQQWWIGPVLGSLDRWPLFIGSIILTAFNDNAAITYLASLVPGLSDELKYAVMAGAVTGGGLTVIANAPNPAGQSILQSQFGDEGISPLKLLLGALAPTAIVGAALILLP